MEFGDMVPGAVENRPPRVLAAAPRTGAIREAERDLETHALVAVQLDARVPLTVEVVFREVLHQLRIPEHAFGVSPLGPATFLLKFESMELRNAMRAQGAVPVGCTSLHILPWSRRFGAHGQLGKLKYRARICLEGVPVHARQAEAVAQLFSRPSFVDGIDYNIEKEDEKSCFTVWIWTDAPSDLALSGTLQIEEPNQRSNEYSESMDCMDLPFLRDAPAKTLDYDIIIHLDRVLVYYPQPDRRGQSYESAISGIPVDQSESQYPISYPFLWRLGVEDGSRPRRTHGRVSAFDRLGGRRDRSPPHGGAGGGDGLGLLQRPPAIWRDVNGSCSQFGGARSGSGNGNDGHGGCRRDGDVPCQPVGQSAQPVIVQWADMLISDASVGGFRFAEGVSEHGHRVEDPMIVEVRLQTSDQIDGGGSKKAEKVQACKERIGEALEDCCAFVPRSDGVLPHMDPMLLEQVVLQQGSGDAELQRSQQLCSMEQHASVPHTLKVTYQRGATQESDCIPVDRLLGDQKDNDPMMLEAEAHAGVQRPSAKLMQLVQNMASVHEKETDTSVLDNSVTLANEHESVQAVDEQELGQFGDIGPVELNLDHEVVNEHMATGLLFDLNVDCAVTDEQVMVACRPTERPVLGAADARLNMDGRDHGGQKRHGKGVALFSVPLKRSLLCNPIQKHKQGHGRKNNLLDAGSSNHSDRKISRAVGLSVEEKATAFLLETSGVLEKDAAITLAAEEQFGEKFVGQMESDLVGNLRLAFQLPEDGVSGSFDALALDADE
ncbi:unnamed protein product [Urochloa humidicola]